MSSNIDAVPRHERCKFCAKDWAFDSWGGCCSPGCQRLQAARDRWDEYCERLAERQAPP